MPRHAHRTVLIALLAVLATLARAQDEPQLSLETLFHPDERVEFGGDPLPDPVWFSSADAWLEIAEDADGQARQLVRVEAESGRRSTFLDAEALAAALGTIPGVSEAEAADLAPRVLRGALSTETAPGRTGDFRLGPGFDSILINHAGDLFYFDRESARVTRLTHGPEPEVGEEFSPDGKLVSFVRGGDIHVVELAGGRERALTRGGSDEILHGRLDWVYQEELYGRGNFKGYWWSPDSQSIAFLRLDESPVLEYTVVDHIPVRLELETTNYPKAGDPNPGVSLGIVSAAGGEPRWVDTARYAPAEHLIVRVSWTPDSRRVVFQVQDREQTWLDLALASPEEGSIEVLLRETSAAWVEVIDDPAWLPDGTFLWQSERSGYRHVYHYGAEGTLIAQVTSGDWDVRELHGSATASGSVFVTGGLNGALETHVYRVAMDGGERVRLTSRAGTHQARFNPSQTLFFDRWSDVKTPPRLELVSAAGKTLRTLDANSVPELDALELAEVSFLEVQARDGYPLQAMLIKPPDFDPDRRYPVLQYNYGGPHAPVVRNRWGGTRDLWHQLLARRGYVIWMCDNRSASGRGVSGAWQAYKQLGIVEMRDIEDGVAWLKSQPWVDPGRIGIWGWSYGGFMAAFALTQSDSFRAAIAGAPVTDWRLYDTIYTERYMLRPQNNPEGYNKTSVIESAAKLDGRLLLIHGTTDDNVHFQHTVKLAYALQEAGKEFELMIYPKSRHRVSQPELTYHMYRLMTSFLERNLLKDPD